MTTNKLDKQKFDGENKIRIFADVPPMPTEDRLQKYKDAGFTHYLMTEDYVVFRDESGKNISNEYLSAIDKAREIGLKIIMRTMHDSPDYFDGFTDELHSRADGYYMCDEPCFEQLDWDYESPPIIRLPKIADWYNANGNDTFFHINLLQSYGVRMLHGTKITYQDYLNHFVETVLKRVKGTKTLSTDYYPLATENGKNFIKTNYLSDLLHVATYAKKLREEGHNVQTAFCIQSSKMEGLLCREVESVSDITFQTNTCLACGAKQLEFYLYAGHGSGVFPDKETQIEYSKTYDYVKGANKEVHVLGSFITDFEWQGMKFFDGKDSTEKCECFENAKKFELEKLNCLSIIDCTQDLIVGEFERDGVYGYMMVNFTEPSLNADNEITFALSGATNAIVVQNGVKKEILIDGNNKVKLGAGESIFICSID